MAKANKFEKAIDLDNILPAELKGDNTSRLSFLRSALPKVKVHVYADNSKIKLSAAKQDDFEIAANAVNNVITLLQTNEKVTDDAFQQTVTESIAADTSRLKQARAKPAVFEQESFAKADNKNIANNFLGDEKNQWLLNKLSQTYGVVFDTHRARIRLTSREASAENDVKRNKAKEIIDIGLELQKGEEYISEKYLTDLIHGEKPAPKTKTVIKNNGRVVQQAVKIHPRQVEMDLGNGDVINMLFDADNGYLKVIESIFDTRINRVKNNIVSIKPSGKPSRAPAEKAQEKLLVEQSQTVLVAVAQAIAGKQLLSEHMIGILVLTAVQGAANADKTRSRLLRTLGASQHPELAGIGAASVDDAASDHLPADAFAKDSKNHRSMNTFGDFGDKFINDIAIRGLFTNRLGLELSYNGRDQKRLTVMRKKEAKVTFEQAFDIINYAQAQYAEAQNTLQPALVENAIVNVLAGRAVDFIPQERQAEFDAKKKHEQYRLSTFNKKESSSRFAYPDTPSQYDMYDMMLGHPSRDAQETYMREGARIGVLIGPAGTGKTFMGVAAGVHVFNQGWSKNIYFLRPQIGTNGKPPNPVPGDNKMKSASALAPIYENLELVMPNDIAAKYVREPLPPGTTLPPNADLTRKIEIGDAGMYRGRTITGYGYIDEAQNLTRDEGKMMMTRVGKGSHLNFSIDLDQIDLPNKRMSFGPMIVIALYEAMQAKRNKFIKGVVCNGNKRDEVVDEALDMFSAFEANDGNFKREKRIYTWENQYEQALNIYYGTADRVEAKKIRDNEVKFGFDKTGYSPMRENMRNFDNGEHRVIKFDEARSDIQTAKMAKAMATELVSELLKQGVIKLANNG